MPAQTADEFSEIFREEHRQVRDCLLELIEAFEAGDDERVGSLLEQVAALTGPHFRYEEEALYPALLKIFEDAYVEGLLEDHDGAIGSAQRLVEIAGQDSRSEEDVAEAVHLIRGILPHVSDCDGLSIMVEVLPGEDVEAVFERRSNAMRDGLNLFDWAAQVRDRPLPAAS